MIKTHDQSVQQIFAGKATFRVGGVSFSAESLTKALRTDVNRDGCAAYAIWESRRDHKEEREHARETLLDRRLDDARREWAEERQHPDLFDGKLTPSWDPEYPQADDIDMSDADIDQEAANNAEFEWDCVWDDLRRATTTDEAIDAVGIHDVVVESVTCGECSGEFAWHWRFCPHCDEPMCPHCDAAMEQCVACDEHVPWTAHERIYAAVERRKDRHVAWNNIISTAIESATRKEVECMDGS